MLCTHAAWALASATSAKVGAPGAATAARKAWRTASAKSSSRCGPASTAMDQAQTEHASHKRRWIIQTPFSCKKQHLAHRKGNGLWF
jgi:hypothetical protein